MSAAVSASRTWSGPDRMSTMRSLAWALAPSMTGVASIGRTGFSTKVPVITPGAPAGCRGGPRGMSPYTSTSFAPAEPASDHARKSFRAGSRFAAARHRIEFKPMADEFVAELIGYDFLQSFDLLVAGAPVAEIVSSQNTGLFKQPHSPIHRSDTDARIDGRGSTVDLLDVGVIDGL